MVSPWQNPLPQEKYTARQVVVYYYRGRWLPITFFPYEAAIALHWQAKHHGYSVFIFPAYLDPRTFSKDRTVAILNRLN